MRFPDQFWQDIFYLFKKIESEKFQIFYVLKDFRSIVQGMILSLNLERVLVNIFCKKGMITLTVRLIIA